MPGVGLTSQPMCEVKATLTNNKNGAFFTKSDMLNIYDMSSFPPVSIFNVTGIVIF